MCLSLVMVVMSVAGLNVALPSLQRELGANASALQWIVDSYGLVFAALLLPFGALGDRFGRKQALMLGLVIFTTGSFIGGLGTTSAQVIVGRVITGIGAAFVMPATLSLLTTIFPPHERRKAIAMWAGFAGAGGALGPIVTGALLEKFWWGSAFLVNVPIVALVLIAVGVFSPNSKDPESTPLDPIGAGLSLVGLGALVYGIIEGPEKGWTSSEVLIAYALAAVGLIGFMAWERRTKHPMLPLRLFKDRRMSVGSAVVTVAFFIMFGLFFLFTLYLQFVRGYSPLAAGLSTLPLAFALIAIAPRTATLSEKLGTGKVMASGFVLIAAGFGVLAFIGEGTPYLVLALALVLLGAGMSLTAAPATGSIMSAVPPAKAGCGLGRQRHHPRGRRGPGHRRPGQHRQRRLPLVDRPQRRAAPGGGEGGGHRVDRRGHGDRGSGGTGGSRAGGPGRRRLHRRLRPDQHRGRRRGPGRGRRRGGDVQPQDGG